MELCAAGEDEITDNQEKKNNAGPSQNIMKRENLHERAEQAEPNKHTNMITGATAIQTTAQIPAPQRQTAIRKAKKIKGRTNDILSARDER
ncbi:hypothetical protein OS493_039365, partial [Desmophyllum pertusum]